MGPSSKEKKSKAKNAKSFLVINVEGAIDEADRSLIESLWWPITNKEQWYDEGKEHPVRVQPGDEPLKTGGDPDEWDDWDKFEHDVIENYVFGYGSLMEEWLDKAPVQIANLKGFNRDWKATMDNKREIPGYKHYQAEPGETEPTHVSFLNISKAGKTAAVTGIVRPLSLRQLAMLDHRERNYLRIDVTDKIEFIGSQPTRPFTIWTYTASEASIGRFEQIDGVPVVSREYYYKFHSARQRLEALTSHDRRMNFKINGAFTTLKLRSKSIDG